MIVLVGAAAVLLAVSWAGVRLARSGPAERPGGAGQADLETRLRPLFREALLGGERELSDPSWRLAVDGTARRLREAAELPDLQILVLDSPVVNAFSLPGGLVAVHRGLLERLRGPEELAAVLAHELGHAANHDAFRNLVRTVGVSVLLTAATGGSDSALRQVLEQALTLHYSRRAEERADRYALDLLARAGLDPGRLAGALERLQTESPPALLRYLDAHPDLEDRIELSRQRSARTPGPERPLEVAWPGAGERGGGVQGKARSR